MAGEPLGLNSSRVPTDWLGLVFRRFSRLDFGLDFWTFGLDFWAPGCDFWAFWASLGRFLRQFWYRIASEFNFLMKLLVFREIAPNYSPATLFYRFSKVQIIQNRLESLRNRCRNPSSTASVRKTFLEAIFWDSGGFLGLSGAPLGRFGRILASLPSPQRASNLVGGNPLGPSVAQEGLQGRFWTIFDYSVGLFGSFFQ